MNKKTYATDEAKVAFFLSFMTEKEALKWKQTFLRSITNDDDAPLCLCMSKQDKSNTGFPGAQAIVVLSQTQNGGNQHARCLWGRNADTAD